MTTVLAFRDLTLGYDRHPAVHRLHGEVEAGSLLAVVGPNGGGKSTLLKGIAGRLRPLDGALRLDGVKRREIAYLPQTAQLDRSFPISVAELAAMGLWGRLGAWRGFGRRDTEAVDRALATVGLGGFQNRPIGTLSGGQLQRALFARLLLQDARLILLDEPFAAIDQGTVADLMALIQRWHGEARTVIAVLHDLELVRGQFPETLLLAREPIARGTPAEVLTAANLFRARQMGEAWDDGAEVCAHDHTAAA